VRTGKRRGRPLWGDRPRFGTIRSPRGAGLCRLVSRSGATDGSHYWRAGCRAVLPRTMLHPTARPLRLHRTLPSLPSDQTAVRGLAARNQGRWLSPDGAPQRWQMCAFSHATQTIGTKRFPLVAAAIASLHCASCTIDGEVAAPDENGLPSFNRLRRKLPALLYAFDILDLDGQDLRNYPIEAEGDIGETVARYEEHRDYIVRIRRGRGAHDIRTCLQAGARGDPSARARFTGQADHLIG